MSKSPAPPNGGTGDCSRDPGQRVHQARLGEREAARLAPRQAAVPDGVLVGRDVRVPVAHEQRRVHAGRRQRRLLVRARVEHAARRRGHSRAGDGHRAVGEAPGLEIGHGAVEAADLGQPGRDMSVSPAAYQAGGQGGMADRDPGEPASASTSAVQPFSVPFSRRNSVLTDPCRLAERLVLVQQSRQAGLDLEHPDLRRLAVRLKGVRADLRGLPLAT